MRGLNVSSAKTGTWVVRVVLPEQDSFQKRARGWCGSSYLMHTFACKLVGPDPAWYAEGTLKSHRREEIDAAKGRFLPGTLWRISKVAFDNKAKTSNGAPNKLVVVMGSPTRFEPVLEGTAPLPFVPIPQAQISNILKLRD